MCGIVGYIANAGVARPAVVQRMVGTLRHRGPDDAGVWADGPAALGHTRLAVVDVSAAGHQPMSTPDGRYTLVFNGEIYNFRELAHLYGRGAVWRSQSDTEVLLHVLARRGVAVLSELRGMFALALWDGGRGVLWLARDPFGKKPLYWAQTEQGFYFASEVKALLAGGVPAEVDRSAIVQYLLHEYVPSPRTGFARVRQVPAGSCAEYRRGELRVAPWWQIAYEPKLAVSFAEASADFDRLLTQAVRRRLVADVPVGILLSGGLDSTAIGWYMHQQAHGAVHSFSVSFAETGFDERGFARRAAAALGTVHHDVQFTVQDFPAALERVAAMTDIPLADASLLPTLRVSELAREQVTVVLDGDGSDELLLGYGTFAAARLARYLAWVPADSWHTLARLSEGLPVRYDYFTLDFKLKQFLKGMAYRAVARRHQVWLGSFSDRELQTLLTDDWQVAAAVVFAAVDRPVPPSVLAADDVVSYLAVRDYLINDILVKLDRAAMMVGLEARTPFLDVDLVDLVARLPVRYRRGKRLLKAVMRGRVPAEIIDRPKHGFALPLGYWLRGPLQGWAREVLSRENVVRVGVVRYGPVDRLLRAHAAGRMDARKQLWTLLALHVWHNRWLESSNRADRGILG